MDKFEQDGKWEGLKGYITNTKLDKEQVIENYNNLWKIEKAFRITKSEINPYCSFRAKQEISIYFPLIDHQITVTPYTQKVFMLTMRPSFDFVVQGGYCFLGI